MKQRILSILLALAMCLSMLPTAAFAVEPDEHDHSEPYCTCETACTEDNRNADCTVCGAEDAQLTDCAQYIAPAPEQTAEPESDAAIAVVQALIDALPTVETVTAEDYDAVQAAYDAYTALSAEQQQSILGADCFEDLFAWFNEQTAAVTTHTHCVCGASHTVIGNHTAKDELTFTAWDDTSALPTEAGNYYLINNVSLSYTWTVSANIILCLNGHSITTTGNAVSIQINNGGTLTVTDCGNTGTITRVSGATGRGVDNAGTFNLYGSTICGHSDNSAYGMAYGSAVYSYGCFNMYGGTISDCTGYYPLTMDLGDTGTIYGGNINVETFTTGTIAGGTFTLGEGQQIEISRYEATGNNQSNANWGVVTGGTFNCKVLNEGTIKGGTFNGEVINNYDINDGTFSGTVTNNADGYINGGTFNSTVTNQKYGVINGGTFYGTVNQNGTVSPSACKTVTFYTASGTTTQKVLCGQKATQPTNSDVSTWYTGVNQVYSFDTPVTQNIDLYSLQVICQHSNITASGYCPDCETQFKVYGSGAYVSGKYYTSLTDAMYYCSDVKLLTNCEETAVLSNDYVISIDLNGKTLTALEAQGNSTVLTIKDNSQDQTGYIGTLNAVYNTHLYGGSYRTITGTVHAGMLPDGYAFQKTDDNSTVKRSEINGTINNVQVVPCTSHSVGTDGKCEYCNTEFAVNLTHGDKTTSYLTFNEAYNAAQSGDTITLLADVVHNTLDKNLTLTIDLNGKTWKSSINNNLNITAGTYTLKNGTVSTSLILKATLKLGDKFELSGNGNTLSLSSGSVLNVVGDDVSVRRLYVSAAGSFTCKLTGGTFNTVEVRTDKNFTIGNLLAEGYGFKTDSGTWYDSTSTETKITNVTVQKLPITGVSITTTDSKTSYAYGDDFTLTANVATTGSNESYTVRWYEVTADGTETDLLPDHSISLRSDALSETPAVGTHTYRAKVTGRYEEYSLYADIKITITKATLEDGFYPEPSAKTDLTYSGSPQTLVGILEDQGWLTYESWKEDMGAEFMFRVDDGTWSAALPTATNAGKYTVDWYIDGGTNYNDVGSETSPAGTISVTIQGKMTVNISGTPTPLTYSGYSQYLLNEEWLGANVTVTAGGNTLSSDQYSLQYKLAEASNWAGAIPAATDVASYTVYIRVISVGDGIGVYTESDTVTLTVDIGKGTHYVAWQGTTPMNVTYGDTDASVVYCGDPWHDGFQCTTSTLTYTVTDGTDVLEVDADTGALTIKKVGTATITATAAGDNNYNENSASVTVTVQPKQLTSSMIDATVKEFTYNGDPHTPTYTVKDGETTLIEGTDYAVSGNISETNAQPYYLRIDGTGNYTGPVYLQWDIKKATLTQDAITATSAIEFTYKPGTEQGPTFKITVGGRELNSTDYSVSGTDKAFDAGEYTITVTGAYPNYEGSAELTWKITPKTLAAEKSPTVYTGLKYNGNAQLLIEKDGISDDQGGGEIVYSAAKDGEYGTFSALYDDPTSCFWGKVVRTYTIWWKVVPSTGNTRNWNDSEPQELTVSISKGDATAPTDRSAYAGSKLSDIPLPDDWTWVDGDQTLSGEGEQTHYANYAGDDNYNSASNVAVTVTVLPKEQRTLGVSMASWTYGDTANEPVYAKTEDATNLTVLYKAESAYDSAYTTTVPTDAGHYTVKVNYETVTEIYVGMANFSINEKNIEKAVITLGQDPTYNGQPQTPEIISVTLGGKSLTQDTDYTVDDCAQTNAGESYYLTIRGTGNYGSMADTRWNINKAPLTISSVTAADKEYDGNTNATITTVTFDGLVNSETLTKDVDYTVDEAYFTENANVRTDKYVSATITLTNSATATNYALSSSIATTQATIHQKPVDVTVTVEDKDYDGTNVATVTATVESGLIEGDSIAITGVTGTFDNANVGTDKTVTIDASGKSVSGSGFGNYYLKFPATAKGTIKAAALTITAKAHSITYGDAPANNGVEYSGFVGGETERVLDGTLDYDYSYQQYGNVGSSYTITPKGLTSGNYAIEFKSGTLTVEQKEVGIDWTHTADLIYTGNAQKPTATATGLVNGDSCTITVTGEQTNAGDNYTATAAGLSNSNYKLPEHVTTSFSIGKANAPTLMAYTTSQCYTIGTEQTVTVNLAAYGVPADANVTGVSAAGVSGKTEQFMTTQSTPTLAGNTMTAKYTISDATKSMVGGSATFSYTVQSQNYKDMTLNIVVTLTDKVQKSLGVTMSGWTYGAYDETANAPVFTAPDDTTETKILYQWQSPTQSGGGSPTTTVPTTPGTYKVFVRCETATEIWNGTATFTISKAIVTITATDKRAYIGVSAPELRNPVSGKDYTVTGLIGEDTLDVTIVLTCDANMNRTGTYDIVPSVTGEDSRYDFTFETGKLTVSEWPVIPSTGTTGKDPDSSTTASNSKKFNDVPTDAYFADAVAWASARNITGGVDETHFGPDLSCTRAQLVTFLWRAADCPEPKAMNSFTDVAANAYYAKAVAWAAENGIVDGYGNGLFGSEDTITREQMAVILYRFAKTTGMDTTQGGMAVREYSDFDQISDYAVSAMQWAVNAGILQGYDGKLMPQQPCTRAQIVTMLYRLLGE